MLTKPREIFSAVARSIIEPADPVAPNAKRANSSLAEACSVTLRMTFKRIALGLRIVILVENFEAIEDGANRIDDVVADPARNQRCEFEIGRRNALVHHVPFFEKPLRRRVAAAQARQRDASQWRPLAKLLYALIHAPDRGCQVPQPVGSPGLIFMEDVSLTRHGLCRGAECALATPHRVLP